MPSRPPSACRRPGCAGLVRAGVCSVCGPLRRRRDVEMDERRGTAAQRGYGGRWQRLRQMYLRSHPLCVACEREGRVTAATDVDHIVPKRWGGQDTDDNFQPLCHACHSVKTNREAKRGLWSGEYMARVVLVGGPPGAGKTHYVQEHKGGNDVIVDVDALVAALTGNPWYERTPQQLHLVLDVREFLLLRLRHPSDLYTAWVITSAASAEERASIAQQCGAAETIMILADRQTCIDHIRNDGRRSQHQEHWRKIVNEWWQDYEFRKDERVLVTG